MPPPGSGCCLTSASCGKINQCTRHDEQICCGLKDKLTRTCLMSIIFASLFPIRLAISGQNNYVADCNSVSGGCGVRRCRAWFCAAAECEHFDASPQWRDPSHAWKDPAARARICDTNLDRSGCFKGFYRHHGGQPCEIFAADSGRNPAATPKRAAQSMDVTDVHRVASVGRCCRAG